MWAVETTTSFQNPHRMRIVLNTNRISGFTLKILVGVMDILTGELANWTLPSKKEESMDMISGSHLASYKRRKEADQRVG